MHRSAPLHPSSPRVPLVLQDALPPTQHSGPTPAPFAPAPSPTRRAGIPTSPWALVLGARRRRHGDPQSVSCRGEALTGQGRCPTALRWVGGWMRSTCRRRSRDPWKPHPTHARWGYLGPQQPQQLAPAPPTPSPQCHQPLPAWRALAEPGCSGTYTGWGCTCSNPVIPSPPPPQCDGGTIPLSLPAPARAQVPFSRDSPPLQDREAHRHLLLP